MLAAAALLGTVTADDSAIKYKDMAGSSENHDGKKLTAVDHQLTALAKDRQPWNPKAWFNYLQKHPQQAEALGVLFAGGVIVHELDAIRKGAARMLRGSATPAVAAEVAEKRVIVATGTAEGEAVEDDAVEEEALAAMEGGAVEIDETGADVSQVEVAEDAEEPEAEIDSHAHDSHDDDSEPFLESMKKPVNIMKLCVALAAAAVFFALRRHAHAKAKRELLKGPHSAAARLVACDSTGGMENTPRP